MEFAENMVILLGYLKGVQSVFRSSRMDFSREILLRKENLHKFCVRHAENVAFNSINQERELQDCYHCI